MAGCGEASDATSKSKPGGVLDRASLDGIPSRISIESNQKMSRAEERRRGDERREDEVVHRSPTSTQPATPICGQRHRSPTTPYL